MSTMASSKPLLPPDKFKSRCVLPSKPPPGNEETPVPFMMEPKILWTVVSFLAVVAMVVASLVVDVKTTAQGRTTQVSGNSFEFVTTSPVEVSSGDVVQIQGLRDEPVEGVVADVSTEGQWNTLEVSSAAASEIPSDGHSVTLLLGERTMLRTLLRA